MEPLIWLLGLGWFLSHLDYFCTRASETFTGVGIASEAAFHDIEMKIKPTALSSTPVANNNICPTLRHCGTALPAGRLDPHSPACSTRVMEKQEKDNSHLRSQVKAQAAAPSF